MQSAATHMRFGRAEAGASQNSFLNRIAESASVIFRAHAPSVYGPRTITDVGIKCDESSESKLQYQIAEEGFVMWVATILAGMVILCLFLSMLSSPPTVGR